MPLPQEFILRLTAQFGTSNTSTILRGFAAKRPTTFRTNLLRTTDEAVMEGLRQAHVMFARVKEIPHAFSVRGIENEAVLKLKLNEDGKIYLQGLTSMLPALILDPQPGEVVADLCAAPGSKTSQMAAMMKNEGKILAIEENSVRYQKLMNTLRIQGATMVEAKLEDATVLHHTSPEMFDKILADVPCSAEGRINLDDQRSYGFWSLKNIVAHAKLQRRLLRSAYACLKPGGTLVYSTCTLAAEENEAQIDWFLAEYPDMKAEVIAIPFSPSITHKNKSLTLLPSASAEGFFVAKMVKKG